LSAFVFTRSLEQTREVPSKRRAAALMINIIDALVFAAANTIDLG